MHAASSSFLGLASYEVLHRFRYSTLRRELSYRCCFGSFYFWLVKQEIVADGNRPALVTPFVLPALLQPAVTVSPTLALFGIP